MIKYCVLALAAVLAVGLVAAAHAETLPSPLKQYREGVPLEQIQCADSKVLLKSPDSRPYCVGEDTAERLERRGWTMLIGTAGTAPVEPGRTAGAQQKGSTGQPDGHDDISTDIPAANLTGAGMDTEKADRKDDGSSSPYHDPRIHHILGGKVTLEGLRKLPNTAGGFWMPVTRAYAEEVIMPLYAGAIGDKVILPAMTRAQLDEYLGIPGGHSTENDTGRYLHYDTELGNHFIMKQSTYRPDIIIGSITFRVEHNLSQGDREEFVTSFAEKIGFDVTKIDNLQDKTFLQGHGGNIDAWNTAGLGGEYFTDITIGGWTNDPLPRDFPLVPIEELKWRAYDFAARHTDIYDEEHCRFELYDKERMSQTVGMGGIVAGGVFTYKVDIGKCHAVMFERQDQVWINVDRETGTIMWPSAPFGEYLSDGWFEKIKDDIPESALVERGADG